MKKTNFDRYLKKQLKEIAFKARFKQAGKAWDVALHMYTAYCPQCRTVTNLSGSITLQIIPGSDGKSETVVSRTYHCESCCSFVRSEDENQLTIVNY